MQDEEHEEQEKLPVVSEAEENTTERRESRKQHATDVAMTRFGGSGSNEIFELELTL